MPLPALHLTAPLLALAQSTSTDLGIDPVTLLQWSEACRLVSEHEDEIWPGYRLGEIPALILNPKVAEVLVRHPRPPEGFVRSGVAGPIAEEPLFVRRGNTTFPVGMDTTTPVGGFTTLVVTDRGARGDRDDAWNLAVMVHEGFHAWAGAHLKTPPQNELDLVEWPDLDPTVNAHLELEGRALGDALAAARTDVDGADGEGTAIDEIEEHALLFLAERTRRRALMPARAVRYEDGNELNEGLASYAEWRAYELWAEHGVGEVLHTALPAVAVPGPFRNRCEQMLIMLKHATRGTLSINGSPFGPGAVRRRGYFEGAAIGKLLDELDPDATGGWKEEVAKGRTLTALLHEALGEPADAELTERALAFEQDAGFEKLVAAKVKLTDEARRARDARIAAVLEGPTPGSGAGSTSVPSTLLVLDLSELSPSGPLAPSAYTPFGILKVDEHRRLYSLSVTTVELSGGKIESAPDAAIILDDARRELLVRTPVAAETLAAALSNWTGRYSDVAVTIEAPAAECSREDRTVRLRLRKNAAPRYP